MKQKEPVDSDQTPGPERQKGQAVRLAEEEYKLLQDLGTFLYRGWSLSKIAGLLIRRAAEEDYEFLNKMRTLRERHPSLTPDELFLEAAKIGIDTLDEKLKKLTKLHTPDPK